MFWKNKLPLLFFCISLGILQGYFEKINIIRQSAYISNGLFFTTLDILVKAIDYRVVIICLLVFAILLFNIVKNRFKGLLRNIFYIPIILSLLMIFDFDLKSIASNIMKFITIISNDLRSGILSDALGVGISQIIVSVCVIVIGCFLLLYLRKSIKKEEKIEKQQDSLFWNKITNKISELSTVIINIIKWRNVLYVIVFAIFSFLNISYIYFATSNKIALKRSPNVIVIQIDTLRSDHVHCYGYKRKTTPNIDLFASQSMRFKKAISVAPWTSASMAQYMTSKILAVKLGHDKDVVPLNTMQMSEVFKNNGYFTTGINSNPMGGPVGGFSRGYDKYDECYSDGVHPRADITSAEMYKTAIKRLDEIKDKKFYMFLLFMDPHSPYMLHKENNFYPTYKGKLGTKIQFNDDIRKNGVGAEDLKYVKSVYDSEIAFTDKYIGMLFKQLKKMNLYNDTLIVLLSDHGEEFYEHGRMEHGWQLYDESISVPLIIKLPGQKTGNVIDGTISLLDLFPSMMDTLKINTSKLGLQGIVHDLNGLKRVSDEEIYSSTDFKSSRAECLIKKEYKLINNLTKSKQELYGLMSDPGEKKNLVKSEHAIAALLGKELNKKHELQELAKKGAIYPQTTDSTRQDIQVMRSLGYAQ